MATLTKKKKIPSRLAEEVYPDSPLSDENGLTLLEKISSEIFVIEVCERIKKGQKVSEILKISDGISTNSVELAVSHIKTLGKVHQMYRDERDAARKRELREKVKDSMVSSASLRGISPQV